MVNVPTERHLKLYFPNGDVVLSASIDSDAAPAGPPRCQLFRVHKFLLMHHSTAFTNMFEDATAGPNESYDGVPIVKMEGDNAEDLAQLLNYLYNPTEMTFKRFDPNTPLVVSGVIRLADKYCIESLREHLIKAVVSDWPTTLDEWDAFQAEIEAVKKRIRLTWHRKPPSEWEYLCDHVPEPASVIVFAQEFGCHQILPAAFSQLMLISPNNYWESEWRDVELVARWSLLDKDALRRYMMGADRVLAYHPLPHQLLSDECTLLTEEGVLDIEAIEQSPCGIFSKLLLDKVWARRRHDGTKIDPLNLLEKCIEYGQSPERHSIPGSFCVRCDITIFRRISSMREHLWANLPDYFQLQVDVSELR
ncbi:hypothetical protein GSI_08695 [Ganoderma sinense ZZ0214-1]|uniref:BTB domain-containing protein n=1 Tax=Ganoderma sinense ZZ0214-1 TaxID=1077348 RepID=A0A2G8S4E8_9APHY|nr:hypothetical protein GSI_08695 [Ganoderma sinense ZZ0214-1]